MPIKPKITIRLERPSGHISRVESGAAVTPEMVKRTEELIEFLSTGIDPRSRR